MQDGQSRATCKIHGSGVTVSGLLWIENFNNKKSQWFDPLAFSMSQRLAESTVRFELLFALSAGCR
jgi:hypothetical protein